MTGDKKRPAGSPSAGEPVFLIVGKIRRSHGLFGEALVEILTDFPERLIPKIVLFSGETHKPLTIRNCRSHNDGLLISFEGITKPEQITPYRNKYLFVESENCPPLATNEYYHHQLLGLSVKDDNKVELGRITEILQTGANDVYVVTSSKMEEILIPVIPGVITDCNLQGRTMTVHLPPGLLEKSEST
jgi:16S rRNA processing protein RimM